MDSFLAELTILNDEVTHQREGKSFNQSSVINFCVYNYEIVSCFDVDEAEIDNRRSMIADGRSDLSGNSRRPTIDSNMSRDKNASRELNLPPRGFTRK